MTTQYTGVPRAAQEHPAPARLPGLTVVLPCFNEAPNVAEAIQQASWAAAWSADDHQIVVRREFRDDRARRPAAASPSPSAAA